eukprot:CAMPEP_0184478100 /NCGR_PEP_ID=MMETSP0113_2-20130426/210_1 /TAXON_ID=91329 /ORGANISM="Norrisiella sphaerica, Strain BC52" /LENGTH=506 /DNA_ID=CAMNT_0026855765 /DNA_START=755 /DNA_END=2275 /DNA_ORIENTATION=+
MTANSELMRQKFINVLHDQVAELFSHHQTLMRLDEDTQMKEELDHAGLIEEAWSSARRVAKRNGFNLESDCEAVMDAEFAFTTTSLQERVYSDSTCPPRKRCDGVLLNQCIRSPNARIVASSSGSMTFELDKETIMDLNMCLRNHLKNAGFYGRLNATGSGFSRSLEVSHVLNGNCVLRHLSLRPRLHATVFHVPLLERSPVDDRSDLTFSDATDCMDLLEDVTKTSSKPWSFRPMSMFCQKFVPLKQVSFHRSQVQPQGVGSHLASAPGSVHANALTKFCSTSLMAGLAVVCHPEIATTSAMAVPEDIADVTCKENEPPRTPTNTPSRKRGLDSLCRAPRKKKKRRKTKRMIMQATKTPGAAKGVVKVDVAEETGEHGSSKITELTPGNMEMAEMIMQTEHSEKLFACEKGRTVVCPQFNRVRLTVKRNLTAKDARWHRTMGIATVHIDNKACMARDFAEATASFTRPRNETPKLLSSEERARRRMDLYNLVVNVVDKHASFLTL